MSHIIEIPIDMLFIKMYCSKCGQRLKLKKRSEVHYFGDSYYQYFGIYSSLDLKQTKIDYVYYCPNCNTTITYERQREIRKMQKKNGSLILSEVERKIVTKFGAVEYYKNCLRLVNELPREIEELQTQLTALENPNLIPGIEEEIKQAEQQLRSLDITISQQDELKAKIRDLVNRVREIPREISDLKNKISDLERLLESAQKHLAEIKE